MMNSAPKDLVDAVQRYFDLMYDCDVSKFYNVFTSTAQLHGFRDGKMTRWTASEYEGVLAKREFAEITGRIERRGNSIAGRRLRHTGLHQGESPDRRGDVYRLSHLPQNRRLLENHLKRIPSARLGTVSDGRSRLG